MKNVVICLNPFESHFIPTIVLAKYLEKANCTVTYMGFSFMANIVQEQGFSFVALESCTNKTIVELVKAKKYKQLENIYKDLHDEIRVKLTEICADIVLIGISRYQFYLIPALDSEKKVYFYSLCGGIPRLNMMSPPITSDVLNTSRFFRRVTSLLLWLKRVLRKGLNPVVIVERCFYPWTFMRKLCRRKKIKWLFGIDGYFPNFPVLVFGTRYLELGDVDDVCYLGLGVNTSTTSSFEQNELSTKPLIYCSLGTMNQRYEKAEQFFNTLISVFREMPQWRLVLSIGCSIEIDRTNLPKNITIYEFAPQISILKKADLAITHGGYGTIKECIKFAVPMVVLPCCYDQRGNAARICFHKIGVRDFMLQTSRAERIIGINTKSISPQRLRALILKVLSTATYKNNILKMSSAVEEANELNVAFQKFFD